MKNPVRLICRIFFMLVLVDLKRLIFIDYLVVLNATNYGRKGKLNKIQSNNSSFFYSNVFQWTFFINSLLQNYQIFHLFLLISHSNNLNNSLLVSLIRSVVNAIIILL